MAMSTIVAAAVSGSTNASMHLKCISLRNHLPAAWWTGTKAFAETKRTRKARKDFIMVDSKERYR